MGVTEDTKSEWDELVKSNKDFKPFANRGWPHYEAMELSMPSKAKGAYAHQGTQPPAHKSRPSSSSSSSSSSIPLDIPSGHNVRSRNHKSSSLDSSNQFSASKLAKANETLQLLRDTIENVGDAIRVLAQPPFVPLPPPPPPHAPTPSASRGAIAAGRFLKHIEGSKERGDVWLSNDEVLQMLRLFQEDEKTASLYIVISERANEALMRMWVKDQLASLTRS